MRFERKKREGKGKREEKGGGKGKTNSSRNSVSGNNEQGSIDLPAERSFCRSNDFELRSLERGLISMPRCTRYDFNSVCARDRALDMFNDIKWRFIGG